MKESNMRQEQAAATRRKLLDSAGKLFAQNGYKGTSVRSINRNVGVADGLLYHYFPGGKEEIFMTIVKESMKNFEQELASEEMIAAYEAMPIEEVLDNMFLNFMNAIEKHIDIMRILLKDNEAKEIISQERVEKMSSHREFWFEKILEDKIKSGELHEMDCQMAAHTINAILTSWLWERMCINKHNFIIDDEKRQRMINYHVSLWKK